MNLEDALTSYQLSHTTTVILRMLFDVLPTGPAIRHFYFPQMMSDD